MLNIPICPNLFIAILPSRLMLEFEIFDVSLFASILVLGGSLFALFAQFDAAEFYIGQRRNGFKSPGFSTLVAPIGFPTPVHFTLNMHSGKNGDSSKRSFADYEQALTAQKAAKLTFAKITEMLLKLKYLTDECSGDCAKKQPHFADHRVSRYAARRLRADKSGCRHRNGTQKCAQATEAYPTMMKIRPHSSPSLLTYMHKSHPPWKPQIRAADIQPPRPRGVLRGIGGRVHQQANANMIMFALLATRFSQKPSTLSAPTFKTCFD